jgi:hypothetical protein
MYVRMRALAPPRMHADATRSTLQVRRAAERAKEKLLHGIKVEAGAVVAAEADHALAAHVRTALVSLPQAVSHYAAEVTEQLLEDNNDITSAQARCCCDRLLTRSHV